MKRMDKEYRKNIRMHNIDILRSVGGDLVTHGRKDNIYPFIRQGVRMKITKVNNIVKIQVLGLGLGVDFTFILDNNDNHNDNDNNDNNPHLNFFKGSVLGVKE